MRRVLFVTILMAPALLGAQGPDGDFVDAPAVEPLPESELLVQILTELSQLRTAVERLEIRLDLLAQQLSAAPDPAPPLGESAQPAPASPPRPVPAEPKREFSYDIVKQWGRDTEAAAKLGKNISTLIGMVLLVPSWSTDDDLIDLGRELRNKYGDYDNINIEVFDDRTSAVQFAENGVAADASRRVMNISKFGDSGRDLILLMRGDSTTTVLP